MNFPFTPWIRFYLPPFSSEEPKSVALPCVKHHLPLLAPSCHLPAPPEAPRSAQSNRLTLFTPLCCSSVLLLHYHPTPSTVISFGNWGSTAYILEGNHSVVPLIVLLALFQTLSSAITSFLKRWEPDLHRFREEHRSVRCIVLRSSSPNAVCFFNHCWAPSWHRNGTIYYIPKILFLNSKALLRAHHLSGEPVLFFPPCVSPHTYRHWFPTAISEPENCSSLAFNRLIAYYK